jgi:predicted AlkP superfamily phosphohydrolase/phosphomutase
MRKLIILGFDGLEPFLLEKWRKELPNFSKLIDKGIYLKMESSRPAESPPAWTSMYTGTNPGKHGIFGFGKRMGDSYDLIPITATDVKMKSLWRILSEQGKKVCVINVPLTFPAEEVNGILVSGRPIPSKKSNFVYPKTVRKKLMEWNYQPIIKTDSSDKEQHLEEIKKVRESIFETGLRLFEEADWDFFMLVLTSTDDIGHFFWHYTDENHPMFKESKLKNVLLEEYKEFDRILREFLERLSRGDLLLVVSDHGFGPCHKYILINQFLAAKGFLRFKTEKKRTVAPKKEWVIDLMNKLFGRDRVKEIVLKLKSNFIGKHLLKLAFALPSSNVSTSNIDWENTKAYCWSEGKLYINLKGREPKGIVEKEQYEEVRERLIECLMQLNDKGKRAIKAVYKKEEIYSGKALEDAPDLLIVPEEKYYIPGIYMERFIQNTFFDNKPRKTGIHRPYGVFLAYGGEQEIKQKSDTIKIVDVFPTVLAFFGFKAPEQCDGKPILSLSQKAKNKIKEAVKKKTGFKKTDLKETEAQKIKKQLRGLGYL